MDRKQFTLSFIEIDTHKICVFFSAKPVAFSICHYFFRSFFFYKTVEISDDSNVSLLLIGLESISYKIYKNIFMLVFFV